MLKEVKTILRSASFWNCLQIFDNFSELALNIFQCIEVYKIRFCIRLITITVHFVQIRFCNVVNQTWWRRITFEKSFFDFGYIIIKTSPCISYFVSTIKTYFVKTRSKTVKIK